MYRSFVGRLTIVGVIVLWRLLLIIVILVAVLFFMFLSVVFNLRRRFVM